MRRSITWMLACAVSLLVGCGGEHNAESSPAPDDQEDVVTQTIIRELSDGSMTQETTFITRAEQVAQIEAREEHVRRMKDGTAQQVLPDIVVDVGCAASSLWLFAGPNLTGNQLCLYKQTGAQPGWFDLSKAVLFRVGGLPVAYWAGHVNSLYSGNQPGSLRDCDPTWCVSILSQSFSTNQRINSINNTDPSGLGRVLGLVNLR